MILSCLVWLHHVDSFQALKVGTTEGKYKTTRSTSFNKREKKKGEEEEIQVK